MTKPIVIVGAGQAAAQAITALRAEGYEGPITLVGDEIHAPYHRPPLSKKFLAGEVDIARLYLKPPEFYSKGDIRTCFGIRATAISRSDRLLTLSSGEQIQYEKLLLATGCRVRDLNVSGVKLDGIHYLRTIADVVAIRQRFCAGARIVIIGGGYIGLEVAAVARMHGLRVTVLEAADRVMARVVDPVVSRFFERMHGDEGVEIATNAMVAAFTGETHVQVVKCDDGRDYEADVVVIGIGVIPNIELAAEAGLSVDNGIVVDECGRTNDPAIYAAGDCTNHPNSIFGYRLRLESVHNGIEQARHAAAALAGKAKAYEQVPWFWSDQYDVKLQIAGLSRGYTEIVVRGDPGTGRSFAVFYLKNGCLIAVDAINRAPEFLVGRQLIGSRTQVDVARLVDERINMKDVPARNQKS